MKKIVYDSYWPADESYPSSKTSFQTFSGFIKDPEVAIYSFAGEEILLEGKTLYSTWKCRKNLFGTYKPDSETVSDKEFQALSNSPISKDIEISTQKEPIDKPIIQHGLYDTREIGAIAQQYRSISIHIPKAYSAKLYYDYMNRFYRIDLIKAICSRFEKDCGKGSGRNFPFGLFELSDGWLFFGSNNGLGISFKDFGMQPLFGNLPKVAFMDCLLDFLRNNYNYGADFDSEEIKLRFIEPKLTHNKVYLSLQSLNQKPLEAW